jgi:hypothetical protein
MQMTALIQAINYLKDKAAEPGLLDAYKKLADLTKQASRNSDGEYPDEVFRGKEALKQLLLEGEPAQWGYASYELFDRINANQLFGKSAAEWLDQSISPETKDMQAVSAELAKKAKMVTKFTENAGKMMQMLEQMIPSDFIANVTEDGSRSSLLIFFEGRLSVQNIADLERYSRLWDGILGTFSALTGEQNATLNMTNFNNGKVILGVVADDKTVTALMTGVTGMLSVLPTILKIRKSQVDLAHLPLINDLNNVLEDEIKILVNNTADDTASKLTLNYMNETTDTEAMTIEMSRTLKQILSFIEKDGKIEFKPLKAEIDTATTNKTLNESFFIARQLETISADLNEALASKGNLQDDSKADL